MSLRPHRRSDLDGKLIPNLRPMRDAHAGTHSSRGYHRGVRPCWILQRAVGYSLSGDTRERAVFIGCWRGKER